MGCSPPTWISCPLFFYRILERSKDYHRNARIQTVQNFKSPFHLKTGKVLHASIGSSHPPSHQSEIGGFKCWGIPCGRPIFQGRPTSDPTSVILSPLFHRSNSTQTLRTAVLWPHENHPKPSCTRTFTKFNGLWTPQITFQKRGGRSKHLVTGSSWFSVRHQKAPFGRQLAPRSTPLHRVQHVTRRDARHSDRTETAWGATGAFPGCLTPRSP